LIPIANFLLNLKQFFRLILDIIIKELEGHPLLKDLRLAKLNIGYAETSRLTYSPWPLIYFKREATRQLRWPLARPESLPLFKEF
jgi:hypothetical protein